MKAEGGERVSRVLLFNIPAEKAALIRAAALRLGLTPVEIDPADFGLPLGLLLGEAGERSPGPPESFSGEMLVMETLSAPLLDALRREGATIALKAVVTEHNRGWSAARLCAELRREHEALHARMPAKPPHTHKKRR